MDFWNGKLTYAEEGGYVDEEVIQSNGLVRVKRRYWERAPEKWVIEEHKPVEAIVEPDLWDRIRWHYEEDGQHPVRVDLLGPYPERGQYKPLFWMKTDPPDPRILEYLRILAFRRDAELRNHGPGEIDEVAKAQGIRDAEYAQQQEIERVGEEIKDRVKDVLRPHMHRVQTETPRAGLDGRYRRKNANTGKSNTK